MNDRQPTEAMRWLGIMAQVRPRPRDIRLPPPTPLAILAQAAANGPVNAGHDGHLWTFHDSSTLTVNGEGCFTTPATKARA